MTQSRAFLIAISILLLLPAILYAEIYKCIDDNNKVTFKTTSGPGCTLLSGSTDADRPILKQRGIKVIAKSGKSIYLYKDYHALVVGISDYDSWPDIQGAESDAKEVAEHLKNTGMKVKLVINPTSKKLKRTLNQLTYGVGKEKNRAILFFYSGHGETETLATGEKMGYIVPKDCPIPNRDRMGFTEKAISMNMIQSYALRIKCKHVLMVFDSCFSGSVFASLKSVPTDISEKSNRPVRQFITAGNEEEQVPDNSIFKTCFLQGISGEADSNSDGYVTGSELGLYLDTSVVNYSRGGQHPQYGKIRHPKLDKGDFIFQIASSGVTIEEPARQESKTTLSVDSNASNARVIMDYKVLGWTPLSEVEVSPGPHRITVEKKGYDTYRKQVRIDRGRSMSLYVDLSKIPPWKARLYVDAYPSHVRVRVLNIGPAFHQGMELDPGRYHVEVSATGHKTKKKWVELSKGEDETISIELDEDAFTKNITSLVVIGKFLEAIKILNEAIELKPNHAWFYSLRGDAYSWLRQPTKAIQDCSKAIELDPDLVVAYRKRAHMYLWLKQYTKVIQDYNKVIELDPDDTETYNDRGDAYAKLKQYTKAIQDFDKAIELDPRWRSYSDRGDAYAKLGQYVRAIQDFDKAIELDPPWWGMKSIYSFRGRAYILSGRISQGCANVKKACDLGNCKGLEWAKKKGRCQSVAIKQQENQSDSTSDVVQRDGIYVAYANGIVKDTKTGLEWKAGPDSDTDWNEARSWVQSLNLDGGGWRMPTTDELKGLYKEGAGNRNMTPLLKTTGWYVWSGETRGSSVAGFFIFSGRLRSWLPQNASDTRRAFAVRSRSGG